MPQLYQQWGRFVVSLVLLGLFVFGLQGCRSSSADAPINAGTFMVDIKVWRVLAQGEDAGNGGNFGCRLTDSEINFIVNRLRTNASIFGGSTQFVWDGIIGLVRNNYDSPQEPTRVKPIESLEWWLDNLDSLATGFTTNKVNIYFTGAYTFVGGFDFANGAGTTDPSEGSSSSIPYRKIVINDFGGGISFGSGFATIVASNVIEHEMAHYLARFRGRTLGISPNVRMYGQNNEHANGNTLLSPSSLPPLSIPGSITTTNTELYEIYRRIQFGLWNSSGPI